MRLLILTVGVSLLAAADLTRCNATAIGEASQVTDVDPGDSPDAEIGAYPFGAAVIDGIVYFSLADAAHGRELWRSDGTAAGTWMVKDLDPGPFGSSPDALTAIGSTLYFGASDQQLGCRLWRSDGTAAGTRPLAVFQSGPSGCYNVFAAAYVGPSQFTAVGSTVFFAARDAAHGEELWRTDGSANGTRLVRDIAPASAESDGSSAPRGLAALDGLLLFVADDGVHGRELWRSDGSAAGTTLVRDVAPGPTAGLGFTTALSTAHGVAVFPATDGVSGYEPWRSDGTEAGTIRLADLSPQEFSSMLGPGPRTTPTVAVGGDVYLWAYGGEPGGFGVWRTDGTSAPEFVGGLPVGSIIVPPTVVGTAAYFAWSAPEGAGLWSVDSAGTTLVRVIPRAPHRLQIGGFLAVDELLVFLAQDDVHGCALWRSDGSEAGTGVVADVNANRTDCNDYTGLWTARATGHVLFEGNDGVTGTEVWALPVEALVRTPSCAGDCNGDARVTVEELVRGVGIALGSTPASICVAFDRDDDGAVSIAELIGAVTAALSGC